MKRIFLVANHSMFGRGVAHLLQQEPALELIGYEPDLDQATPYIQELEPDIVVLATHDASDLVLLGVMRLLHLMPQVKVFILSLQDNQLHIYQGTHHVIQELGDLTKAFHTQTVS